MQSETKNVLGQCLQQITTFAPLGGRPGVKPSVGVGVAVAVVNGVGLSEGISALCTPSQFITVCCIQVSPFDFRCETTPYAARLQLLYTTYETVTP